MEKFPMDHFKPPEHAEIVQLYIQNNFSIVKTERAIYHEWWGSFFVEWNREQAKLSVLCSWNSSIDSWGTTRRSKGDSTVFALIWSSDHSSLRVTKVDLLKCFFPRKLISKKGDSDWPPRSPDLTGPDFLLWVYLKSKVYINKPRNLRVLKANIRWEIRAISAETLAKVMGNVEKRAHATTRKAIYAISYSKSDSNFFPWIELNKKKYHQ